MFGGSTLPFEFTVRSPWTEQLFKAGAQPEGLEWTVELLGQEPGAWIVRGNWLPEAARSQERIELLARAAPDRLFGDEWESLSLVLDLRAKVEPWISFPSPYLSFGEIAEEGPVTAELPFTWNHQSALGSEVELHVLGLEATPAQAEWVGSGQAEGTLRVALGGRRVLGRFRGEVQGTDSTGRVVFSLPLFGSVVPCAG